MITIFIFGATLLVLAIAFVVAAVILNTAGKWEAGDLALKTSLILVCLAMAVLLIGMLVIAVVGV